MNQNSVQPLHAYPADRFNTRSAEVVVPLLIEMLDGQVDVESVLDVGCGIGTWLAVFLQHGITDVRGLDGAHVDPDALAIPPALFTACDLAQPPALDHRYSLALCLEVGEHLPARLADTLVDLLTAASDVVAFSAAVPGQGGQAHLNEQWPAYWARKFQARGYRCHDGLRHRLWNEEDVEWWYRQNLLLFIRDGVAPALPAMHPPSLVHPGLLAHTHERYRLALRQKGGVRGVARELGFMARRLLPGRKAQSGP